MQREKEGSKVWYIPASYCATKVSNIYSCGLNPAVANVESKEIYCQNRDENFSPIMCCQYIFYYLYPGETNL